MKKSLFSKIALALVLVSVSTQAFSFGVHDFRQYLATHPKAKTALSIAAGLIPSLTLMATVACEAARGNSHSFDDNIRAFLFASGLGMAFGCLTHKYPVIGSATVLAYAATGYLFNLSRLPIEITLPPRLK